MEISKENKAKALQDIQTLRETKGKEQETLTKISELKVLAENEADFDLLSTLFWEESLVWQHLVMASVAEKTSQDDGKVIEAKTKMGLAAQYAYDVIKTHDLTKKEAVALRFLGRVANYSGAHRDAKSYYERALDLVEPDSFSKLEIEGFLATTLILIGNTPEGLEMAKRVYADFENTPLGKTLKEKDYYVWAIWKTGIPTRVLNALNEINFSVDVSPMQEWLFDSLKELKNPTMPVTWGDEKFQFRIEEIENCLRLLI